MRPKLLVAAADGTVYEHPTLEMAIDNGNDVSRAGAKDLIALPEGWDLMAMPGTRPIGYDPQTAKFTTVTTFTDDDGRTFEPWAVAVHPPPGYVRAYHPAAEYTDATHPDVKLRALEAKSATTPAAPAITHHVHDSANGANGANSANGANGANDANGASRANGANASTSRGVDVATDAASGKARPPSKSARRGLPVVDAGGDDNARPGLPLWAYTAVGMTKKGPVAALFVADETTRWAPSLYYQGDLKERIAKRVALDPDNQVLRQLAQCAGDYLCCCAQNVFYERWEGAVPIAPACTAACLGCLSKDPEWGTPTPQKRLKFQPTPDEIARVIAHHLERAPEPMMSFGQGCEGEPTMNGPVIVESIRRAREKTKRGVINVNTNGSRPETVRECARAGATALRISINTFDRAMYTLYYRPGDYDYDDVIQSLYVGRDEGMHVSINLLIWPGWSDRMAEVDAISKIVEDGALQMIQLRNLCVDPGYYRTVLPKERGILLGMRGFVDELHRRHPKLRFGTFNPRLAAEWYESVPAFAGRL